MNQAARRLKGHRNHRDLAPLGSPGQNGYQPGARLAAEELSAEHGVPVFIQRQEPKHLTTSDGRKRTTFDGFYLAFSRTDQTIEAIIPEGYVEPETEDNGRLTKVEREQVAASAVRALADAMDAATEYLGADHADQVRAMLAAWARRVPGAEWDSRLGEREPDIS
jgi:hypothetical protein